MTSANPFARFIDQQGFAVLDGGLGTALESAGHTLDSPLWSAELLRENPAALLAVHTSYLDAGADCIVSAGYQASFEGLAASGLSRLEAEEVVRLAVTLALEARDAFWADETNRSGRLRPIVGASIGSYGAYLADGSEYSGRYGVDDATLDGFHRPRFEVLADTAADLLAYETIPSLEEAGVIGRLLAERPDRWAWVSFTVADGALLRDGSRIEDAVRAVLRGGAVAAVGANCLEPRFAADVAGRIREVTGLPIMLYPNSGESYDVATGAWSGGGAGAEWIAAAERWPAAGATVLGGCCRVGPEQIRELRARLVDRSRGPGRNAGKTNEGTT